MRAIWTAIRTLASIVALVAPANPAQAKQEAAQDPAAANPPAAATQPSAAPEDVDTIDAIVTATYDAISGAPGEPRDWDRLRSLLHPEARMVPIGHAPDGRAGVRHITVDEYIESSGPLIEQIGFREEEVARRVERFGSLAQVLSTYAGYREGMDEPFLRGVNALHLFHDGSRWWVLHLFWEAERPDLPLPARYLEDGPADGAGGDAAESEASVRGAAAGRRDPQPVDLPGLADGPLAIRNVTVVPMDRERVLADHTVLVRDGRIASVGPTSGVEIPDDAEVIDGEGRFLMPGLVDMHIHVVNGTGEAGDGAWQQMGLLVANGITTARGLGGAPTALELREAVRDGALLGPRLYLAGPSLNHQSVSTPEAVRAAVREQAAAGFDMLKTHGVTSDVYDALVEAAAAEGLPLVGHVTPDFGLDRALEAGQQIEHLDGYLVASMPEAAPVAAPAGQIFHGPELDYMQTSAMADLARRTREADVWNTPTLALFEIVANPRPVDHYATWPEMSYVPPKAKAFWVDQITQLRDTPATADRRERYVELRRAMVRELRSAGAPLLAGSDSPQFFLAPGFSLHRELAALQEAGLTPFEVLQAATGNPARWFGAAADFGVVETGRAADLLLLSRNPLEDVAHAAEPDGVVLGGRWLSRDVLGALKESIAAAAAGS